MVRPASTTSKELTLSEVRLSCFPVTHHSSAAWLGIDVLTVLLCLQPFLAGLSRNHYGPTPNQPYQQRACWGTGSRLGSYTLACGNCHGENRRTWGLIDAAVPFPVQKLLGNLLCQSCPSLRRPKRGGKYPWARTLDYRIWNEARLQFRLMDSAPGEGIELGDVCPRHFARLISVGATGTLA